MTDSNKSSFKLDRIRNAIVEDILNTSDEDILAEVADEYGDPLKIARDMKVIIERVVGQERPLPRQRIAEIVRSVGDEIGATVRQAKEICHGLYIELMPPREYAYSGRLSAEPAVTNLERDVDLDGIRALLIANGLGWTGSKLHFEIGDDGNLSVDVDRSDDWQDIHPAFTLIVGIEGPDLKISQAYLTPTSPEAELELSITDVDVSTLKYHLGAIPHEPPA